MAMTKEEKTELIPLKTKAEMAEEDSLDSRLEAAIEDLIKDKSKDVRAAAKDGLVTLFGSAPDSKVKRDIVVAIKAMPGVREVTNHIKVTPVEA